jgi:hypothetical protein
MAMRENQTDGKIGPECFLNRELSWLEFNLRVLEEAENTENPLMERLKFLAIFSSNLDEFFMVRLAGVREQAFGESAPQDYAPDGLSAIEQLKAVAKRTQDLVARQYRCLKESIGPAMAAEGFELLRYDALEGSHREHVDRFFRERVLPILTPMAVDPAHPSPRYHNRGLYLGVMLEHAEGLGPKRLFAVVQVPQVLPRIVVVPSTSPGRTSFVLLEDVVAARLPELFGGFQVRSWTSFRITRDSDLELLEQESDDMLRLIEDRLKARQRGQAVRIEIASKADESLAHMIIDAEDLHDGRADGYSEVYRIDGPLDLTALWDLYKLPGFEKLHDKPFIPRMPRGLDRRRGDIFSAIAAGDILLHHPYESFDPVVDFVTSAANDPACAGHQADALPHQRRLAHLAGADHRRGVGQAGDGTGGTQGPLRRGQQRELGAADGAGRRARRVWIPRPEDPLQGVDGGAKRGAAAPSLCASGHRQLQPDAPPRSIPTSGLFTADEADSRGRLGALQPAHRLLAGPCLEETDRGSKRPPPADDLELIEEQTRAGARAGQPARIFAKMNSLVDHHRDRGALSCQPGRRADRHRLAWYLLPAAGSAGVERDDPRAQRG